MQRVYRKLARAGKTVLEHWVMNADLKTKNEINF
jgi:hypothetical protein